MIFTDGKEADWIGVKKKKTFRNVKLWRKLFVKCKYNSQFINLKDTVFIYTSSAYQIFLEVLRLDVDKLIINA